MSYWDEIEAAAARYEEVTGHRPANEKLDPSHTAVRKAYAAFLEAPAPIGLGANDGEWIALRAGIKPMVRELVERPQWEQRRREVEADGWVTGAHPLPVSEDAIDGYTFDSQARHIRTERRAQSGDKPEDRYIDRVKADTKEASRVLWYIASDQERIDRARELDEKLMAYAHTDAEQALMGELGELLGYPTCCVEAYTSHDRIHRNREVIARAAARSSVFHPLLNNLSLSFFHYIGWFPCRYDCEHSIAFAQRVDDALRESRPREAARVRAVLSRPRIYLDDRRQLIFDGAPDPDGAIRYQQIHTPFALDRSPSTVAFDWVFYADIAAPLLAGNRVVLRSNRLAVYLDDEAVTEIELPDGAIALPFTDSSEK